MKLNKFLLMMIAVYCIFSATKIKVYAEDSVNYSAKEEIAEQTNDGVIALADDLDNQTGWVQDNEGNYYYYYSQGEYCADSLEYIFSENDETYYLYYFDQNGIMASNQWIKYEGSTYYFGSNGAAVKGVCTIDGTEYYFYDSYCLATNEYDYNSITTYENYLVKYNSQGEVIEKTEIIPNQFIDFDGGKYCYDENYLPYEGIHTIDGIDYYFYGNGRLATDDYGYNTIINEDGYLINVDSQGVIIEKQIITGNTWIQFNDHWYYFDENLNPYEGVQTIDGIKYYFDYNGQLEAYGFEVTISTDTFFIKVDKDGIVIEEVMKEPNKWILFDNHWYYFDEDLESYDGVKEINGIKYYFFDGCLGNFSFDTQYENTLIHVASNGVVDEEISIIPNKWILFNGQWYYFDENYEPYQGFKVIDNKTYYFNQNGTMYIGLVHDFDIDAMYAFGNDGVMVTGWYQNLLDSTKPWYYFDDDGKGHTGWLNDTYYFNNGYMCVGYYYIDNKICVFNNDGTLSEEIDIKNGWNQIESYWYYFENDDFIKEQWKEINNSWYHFNYYGRMDSETFIYEYDDYENTYIKYVTKNGNMLVNSWYLTPFGYVYADSNGYLKKNEWFKDGNEWYYFLDAFMVDNNTLIEGKIHLFNSNGAWIGTSNVTNGWIYAQQYYYYGGDWYYLTNGKFAEGWQYLDNNWYYFDLYDYRAYEGDIYYINGTYYVFDSSCKLSQGWYKTSWGKYYYSNNDGVAQTGWQYIGNNWYYFNEVPDYSYMYTGLKLIDGQYCLFAETGEWLGYITDNNIDGWHCYNNQWYYSKNGNYLFDQWILEGNTYYYFDYNMSMFNDDILYIDEYAHYVPNDDRLDSKGIYFAFNKDGSLKTNQDITINGHTYYVDNQGIINI